MIRYVFFLIVAITGVSLVAYAQEIPDHKGTAEQQRACRADVLRLCREMHEDEAIYTCLKANTAKLHSACRKVMEGRR